jgi:hypothetical protein
MKARISQLSKTESEWALLQDFVPLQGELIIFSPDRQYRYSRLKVGDGTSKLNDLPFFIDYSINDFLENNFNKILDAGRITEYKQ